MPEYFSDEMAARVMRATFTDRSGTIADCEYINRFGTNSIPVLPLSSHRE